jgi:hypothetical protein
MGNGSLRDGMVLAADADGEAANATCVLTEGGRVSVVDNTLWADNEEHPCATVRVTLSRERAVEIPGFAEKASDNLDPSRFRPRNVRAAHGKPWFMDAMEARMGDDVAWFRLNHPIIEGAGPLSSCSDLRTGPMALRGPSRTSSRIPIQT